ncbi:hypothetical protein PMAYCL1PPCAC_03395, partial [Pristionchus mayeri]
KISQPTIAPHVYLPTDEDKPEILKRRQIVKIVPMNAGISAISEKDQTIKVSITLFMAWVDHRLRWNPKDYGGLTSIDVTRESIWVPPVHPTSW